MKRIDMPSEREESSAEEIFNQSGIPDLHKRIPLSGGAELKAQAVSELARWIDVQVNIRGIRETERRNLVLSLDARVDQTVGGTQQATPAAIERSPETAVEQLLRLLQEGEQVRTQVLETAKAVLLENTTHPVAKELLLDLAEGVPGGALQKEIVSLATELAEKKHADIDATPTAGSTERKMCVPIAPYVCPPPAHHSQLETAIGVQFINKQLLIEALTHRSAARRSEKHNERLEYFGDAVLGFIAKQFLLTHSAKEEGKLREWYDALACGEHLSQVARDMGLGKYLFISHSAQKGGERDRDSILEGALEALIGAVSLDQGLERSERFIRKFILSRLKEIVAEGKDRDAKSYFQEIAQARVHITPTYCVLKEERTTGNSMIYTVVVCLDDEEIAQGTGNSKKQAEKDAAAKALKIKRWY